MKLELKRTKQGCSFYFMGCHHVVPEDAINVLMTFVERGRAGETLTIEINPAPPLRVSIPVVQKKPRRSKMKDNKHQFLFEIDHSVLVKAANDDEARGQVIKACMNNVRDLVNAEIDKLASK